MNITASSANIKKLFSFLFILLFFLNGCWRESSRILQEEKEYFYNPIVEDNADPWVIQHKGFYFYCFTDNKTIFVTKSKELQNIGKEKQFAVWHSVEGTNYSDEIWAPELHCLWGKWYIYFAADDGDNYNHRIYVLESSSDFPQSAFNFKGQICDSSDKWAIDGTVFENNNKLYFLWSGWEGDVNVSQNLYIAPMVNPWTINGKRVLISSPELPWEKNGAPLINEGPEILKHKERVFIVYSASGSWTDDYCLGLLVYNNGDILSRNSWKKYPDAVFSRTDSVFGPGHASFVKSPEGSEDWIVYHAAKEKGSGWDRNVRTQRFTWKGDTLPDFGKPISLSEKILIPKR